MITPIQFWSNRAGRSRTGGLYPGEADNQAGSTGDGAFICLSNLRFEEYWAKRIADENERLRFILASYNAGVGHVEDAQRLTEKYGGNPEVWEDVAYWLLQKSTQQYSGDRVVKFGFCRGLEPLRQSHTRTV